MRESITDHLSCAGDKAFPKKRVKQGRIIFDNKKENDSVRESMVSNYSQSISLVKKREYKKRTKEQIAADKEKLKPSNGNYVEKRGRPKKYNKKQELSSQDTIHINDQINKEIASVRSPIKLQKISVINDGQKKKRGRPPKNSK